MRRWIAFAALAAALAPGGRAGAEAPQVHALLGARVVVEPGRILESATVVLRDGVIEAVGPEAEPPADARLWDLEGLTVYAGLIEPYAIRPRPETEGEGAGRQGAGEAGVIRPESRVSGYAADEATARGLREAGFTTALMAPAEGIFRGRGALLNLGEGELGENLLRDGFCQFAALRRSEAGYPRSLMGSVALFRQTLLDAAWHAQARRAYERRPSQPRPPFDGALEALAATAAGDELIVLESADAVDSLRLAALVAELGLEAWLVGNGEEYRWLEPIAAAGLTHLLPLDLPEKPAVGDEDDLTVSLAELRHWDEAPANPRRLLDAGVQVAFTSHGLSEPKQLHANLARAIEHGLTADEALAALTTTPARLLGIADRAGTVSAGKMANLAVVEGDLFGKETRVRELWIDGRHYEIKESEPPEVEPAGSWRLTVETPDGQQIPVRLVLAGEAVSLSGTISAMGSDALALAGAEVSGSTVEISFDGSGMGMPGTVTFTLEIDGDEAAGSGVSPRGPFTITGSRSASPEETS
jgi:imidazolonepropionase-like amidohydrolase